MDWVGLWDVHPHPTWVVSPAALQILAILLVLMLSMWLAARRGLDPKVMYWAGVCGIVGALAGGQLWAGLSDFIIRGGVAPGWTGSRSVIGAFCGALLAGGAYIRWTGRSLPAHADAAVPAIALGYAVARLGCLLAGDDFGISTAGAWGLRFGSPSEALAFQVGAGLIAPDATLTLPVHPTQIYHALLGLTGFAALLRIKGAAPGMRLAAALMMYGAGRFVIEFFRGDAIPIWGPLDINHFASLVMLAVGIAIWRPQPQAAFATARGEHA